MSRIVRVKHRSIRFFTVVFKEYKLRYNAKNALKYRLFIFHFPEKKNSNRFLYTCRKDIKARIPRFCREAVNTVVLTASRLLCLPVLYIAVKE
jgi:hypothetical protein